MRCCCCNKNLSDKESTMKHPITGEYLDTCRKCLQDIPITPVESSLEDEEYFDDDTAVDNEFFYADVDE